MRAAADDDAEGAAARVRTAAAQRVDRARRGLHGLSLRARLIALVTGLLVVALVFTGAVTLYVLRGVLIDQVDSDLVPAVPAVMSSLSSTSGGGPRDLPSDYVVQFLQADGSLLGSRQGPNQRQPVLSGITRAWVTAHGTRPATVVSAQDGRAWRVVAETATDSQTGDYVTVLIARPLYPIAHTLTDVAGYFLLIGLAVVLTGVMLGAIGIRRAFRPLRDVEAVAAAFGGGDTSRRVAVQAPGTEVGRLGSSVNAMLDRIETSLAAREASEGRMRRFVADASHELRTPLAAVRGYAELHRLGGVRDEHEVDTAFTRIETEATRMGGLVEDLLVLARLDEQRPLRHEPVDLLTLVVDARHDARALAPDRTTTVTGVDGRPPLPVLVTGDEAKLRQVVANLLANALRHTPAGTPVELGVGARDGWALVQVVDHGPGIAAEDAERVFERFWRADTSRQRGAGGGSGLGMAIVAGIVAAHEGAVRVVTTPGGGATIELALPLAGAPLDDGPSDDGTDDDVEGADDEQPADDGATVPAAPRTR